nr:metallophosphoesterase [Rhodococcus sp. HNM0569]
MLVFAVLLALITWWLHRRLVRATALTRPWSTVADAALLILYVLAVVGVGSGEAFATSWARPVGFAGWAWIGAGLYLLLGLGALAAVSGIVRVAARRPHDESRRRALRVATGAVVVAAVGAAGYGVAEAARPRVTTVRVPLRRLPAEFDGVRVALVADLHVGPARGEPFTRRVVDLVLREKPDLVILGGDLTDGVVDKVAPDLAPLADLHAPLGVFGVSGNHESYADDVGSWLDVWEDLGVRVLRNEHVTLTRDGAAIDVAGVYDFDSKDPYAPDLPAALAGHDPDRFVLLAAHQPKQVVEASELGVDLQLSGHTHGGQMWPLGVLVPLQQPTVTGLDRFGDTLVYTTRGVGTWGPPVRVATPPELTILELARDAG